MRRYLQERDEEQADRKVTTIEDGESKTEAPVHRRREAVRAGAPASGHRSTRQWVPTGTGTEPDTQGREQKGVAPNKIVATRCLGSNPANGIQFHRPFVSVTAGFSIYGWRPDKRRQFQCARDERIDPKTN